MPLREADRAVRVIMVDDHVLVRQGLKELLQIQDDVLVVGEAGGGEEALRILDAVPCDIVMLDIGLGDDDGIECMRRIKQRQPGLPVLILSMHVDDAVVVEALDAGADGYLVKSASREELVRALCDVRAGRPYLHPKVSGAVLSVIRGRRSAVPPPDTVLTSREQEILHLMAGGQDNREIGDRLHLSRNTVKTHLRSIYRKLSVSDRTSAVVAAMRDGIIPCAGRSSLA